MGKRIEMDLEEKEYLIQECLAGRMRMREAARRAGVGHSTMHNWISRYRAEGASALSENGNAQKRTYSEALRQKVVEEYLSGQGSSMAIAEKYKLRSGNLVLDWAKEYHRHREQPKETGGVSMARRNHTMEERVQAVREYLEEGLLPYPVIIAATKGDPEAMAIVVKHYESYITVNANLKL